DPAHLAPDEHSGDVQTLPARRPGELTLAGRARGEHTLERTGQPIWETSRMNVLSLIGRQQPLFATDVQAHEAELSGKVAAGRFLVIGGAGSIGQAVTREIFKRNPAVLHVV